MSAKVLLSISCMLLAIASIVNSYSLYKHEQESSDELLKALERLEKRSEILLQLWSQLESEISNQNPSSGRET